MDGRISIAPHDKPRRTVATRILASFTITLLAFGITLGWSVVMQRRAAQDNDELTKGFLPVALRLGQLRATQATLAALIDGLPDERNPHAARRIIELLTGVRRAKVEETRTALLEDLRGVGNDETRQLALELAGELDAAKSSYAGERSAFARLFFAFDAKDSEVVNQEILSLGRMEHEGERRFKLLSEKVERSIAEFSAGARARERRSVGALALLAALTFAVGVWVSIHTRRLLVPLERVTERARSVALGDLTPQPVEPADDEIGQLAAAFEQMVGAVAKAQSRAVSNERLAAIGKMAAHVTHEIRNPLSAMGLNVELLEEELGAGASSAEVKSLLAAIGREVQRLEQISEEYLRVARLPSPRMETDDIPAAIAEIVAFARPEIERAGCEVTLEVDEHVPAAAFDEGQIRQALLNLLRNAREAMPNGGKIEVSVRAEGMGVSVGVDDRGGGIPEDIRSRVFDPFFSTKGEGTGLGLAITRHIVEAHGGSLTCDAREGGGTSFRMHLPIAPDRTSGPMSARAAV